MFSMKMSQLWLLQRLSAILILAFLPAILFGIIEWTRLDLKLVPYWFTIGRVIIFGLFMNCVFLHSYLGIEIIIQDYVPQKLKSGSLWFSKYFHVFVAIFSWIVLFVVMFEGSKK